MLYKLDAAVCAWMRLTPTERSRSNDVAAWTAARRTWRRGRTDEGYELFQRLAVELRQRLERDLYSGQAVRQFRRLVRNAAVPFDEADIRRNAETLCRVMMSLQFERFVADLAHNTSRFDPSKGSLELFFYNGLVLQLSSACRQLDIKNGSRADVRPISSNEREVEHYAHRAWQETEDGLYSRFLSVLPRQK